MQTRLVCLAATFTQGEPLDRLTTERVQVPEDLVDEGDAVYRVVGRGIGPMNIRVNDLLIVQLRPSGEASTAEIVLVESDGLAYVGRWWAKQQRRAVLDEKYEPIVEGPGIRVIGAITTIARLGI